MIKSKLDALQTSTQPELEKVQSLQALDDLKAAILGKKGQLTDIMKGLGALSPEERPLAGQMANEAKENISAMFKAKQEQLENLAWQSQLENEKEDLSKPSGRMPDGHRHPLKQTMDEIITCLARLGFSVKEGPEVETDYYNFEALNIPASHPARDMHDTFYLKDGRVLRTHTSPVQVHVMENQKPPIKIIVPGKVYRRDSDVSHSPVFHQIEGLYVDENVSFAELKGTLTFFLNALFGASTQVRFRPSYFPFTEPSCEVDVSCVFCKGAGCGVCKKTGWLEILGAGMVHQNVFNSVGYDPEKTTGFAFGLGVERIAMLKYNISDIRLFYENDLRFLNQF